MFGYSIRLVCSVLEEMRQSVKTLNIFTYNRSKNILLSQLEEIQCYVNRMESALEYQSDIRELYKKRKKIKGEVTALKKELKSLKPIENEKNDEESNRERLIERITGDFSE